MNFNISYNKVYKALYFIFYIAIISLLIFCYNHYHHYISAFIPYTFTFIVQVYLFLRIIYIFNYDLKVDSKVISFKSFQLFHFDEIDIDMIESIKTTDNVKLKDRRFNSDSVVIDIKFYGRKCRFALSREDYKSFLNCNCSFKEKLDVFTTE